MRHCFLLVFRIHVIEFFPLIKIFSLSLFLISGGKQCATYCSHHNEALRCAIAADSDSIADNAIIGGFTWLACATVDFICVATVCVILRPVEFSVMQSEFDFVYDLHVIWWDRLIQCQRGIRNLRNKKTEGLSFLTPGSLAILVGQSGSSP